MRKSFCFLILLLILAPSVFARRIPFSHLGRRFSLYVPKGNVSHRPLLVVLHGCKQSADLILDGTMLEAEAEKRKFVILAPEQSNFYNIDHCWNWFLPINQKRGQLNEMEQIISGIERVAGELNLDKDRIYITGISAGGVMSHNLSVCYPDVFAGAAIHSGLAFKVAESVSEAQTVLTSYEQKSPSYLGVKAFECSGEARFHRLNKVLIIHGLSDSRVPSFHADLISKAQTVWRDFLDDGKNNNSTRPKITTELDHYPNNYWVEKVTSDYTDFYEVRLMIKNLGHAWGGGKPVSVNFDPNAPSSNEFILDFFLL
jgi:poly(hydroxyalkanoate) depolymerase family esterase